MKDCSVTANTILYCRAWQQTVEFYRDALKLPVLFSTNWFVEFRLNAMSRLSIANEKKSSIQSCEGQGVTIALEVLDVEAVRSGMVEDGLKPTPLKNHPWGARVFYLFDPEGHRIEIWQLLTSETKEEESS